MTQSEHLYAAAFAHHFRSIKKHDRGPATLMTTFTPLQLSQPASKVSKSSGCEIGLSNHYAKKATNKAKRGQPLAHYVLSSKPRGRHGGGGGGARGS